MAKSKIEEEIENEARIVQFSKQNGVKNNITGRTRQYPKKFYQVLGVLDLVMRVYNGEEMGTSGVDELAILMAVLYIDRSLLSCLPKDAHIFFKCILNPKNAWKICSDGGLGYGYIHRAYSELRTYLIDNKERISEVYERLYDFSSKLSDEMDNKYAKILQEGE